MKKKYIAPTAVKLEFNYADNVVASSKCGGVYREFTDNCYGCHTTPTENWVRPFSSEG